ncbi:phosphoenolpyruvate carboxylase, partial [Salmonella enterica]|uniref:phosphoenolpyruvate carboxylase n=1 Tax=Salmonella enterica TaxID=28901 RepID=UPI00217F99F9
FWLSDAIAHVLHNPDLAPLIKTLSLAFIVIPHGQQFRALMQKVVEDGKQSELEAMCRDWPFFSTRLGMLEMVFSKADLWLA